MTEKETIRRYGSARISPGTARAGEVGQWNLTYRVGETPFGQGDVLVVSTDSDTDWEEPQTKRPERTGFVAVDAPDGVTFALRILGQKKLEVRILAGTIEPGETIGITFGKGSGSRMQTFAEEKRFFHLTRLGADGSTVRLPDPPFLRVLGGLAVRLAVSNPSTAAPGGTVSVLVKAEDEWGNPASDFSETVNVRLADREFAIELPRERAAVRIEMTAPSGSGFHRIEAACGSFRTRGNPLLVGTDPDRSVFWGDFHGGQVADANKIDAYYEYAKEISNLDFSSYQRNDHEMTDEDWEIQKRVERKYHLPGEFIAMPGYEWSADTHLGGDRTVLFPRYGMPLKRSSSSAVDGESGRDEEELPDLPALYRYYRLSNTVLIPHVGGRQADISLHEPELEPLVEIASTHGTFEWFYLDSLRRGYISGVVAGSDGYTGRPGGEFPGFITRRFSRSGAAAILADELSLDGILDAARNRRTYGTSGPRMWLDLEAGGARMGDRIAVERPPELNVTVAGTAPIERIDVFRRDRLVHSVVPECTRSGRRWRVLMRGAASRRSYSGVQWIGRLQLDGGTFTELRPIRFDSPRSTVSGGDTGELSWDTTSCGYAHGFEFSIDGPGTFDLSVRSFLYSGMYGDAEIPGTMKITRAPAEEVRIEGVLDPEADAPEGRTVPLGLIDRSITIEPVPEGLPEEFAFSWTDPDPVPGIHPCWIRVTQRDMHQAWSSPVFVSLP